MFVFVNLTQVITVELEQKTMVLVSAWLEQVDNHDQHSYCHHGHHHDHHHFDDDDDIQDRDIMRTYICGLHCQHLWKAPSWRSVA